MGVWWQMRVGWRKMEGGVVVCMCVCMCVCARGWVGQTSQPQSTSNRDILPFYCRPSIVFNTISYCFLLFNQDPKSGLSRSNRDVDFFCCVWVFLCVRACAGCVACVSVCASCLLCACFVCESFVCECFVSECFLCECLCVRILYVSVCVCVFVCACLCIRVCVIYFLLLLLFFMAR